MALKENTVTLNVPVSLQRNTIKAIFSSVNMYFGRSLRSKNNLYFFFQSQERILKSLKLIQCHRAP